MSRTRLRRRGPVLFLVVMLVAAFTSVVAGAARGDAATTTAATTAGPLGLSCGPYGGPTICSGEVPSFDGSILDVDVTRPTKAGGTHPLIVMLHGFGNDKHEWESTDDIGDNADKWHWNSHWFATHGYYVLTYTARGFGDDGASASYEPATPAGTSCPKKGSDCLPAGTIRVKNKNVEIRDTQWLAAKVTQAFPGVDANRVAVTGGSYGGGESWLQAAEPVWTFPQTVDPTLPKLTVQVAVPKYPWTDLAYSLAPSRSWAGRLQHLFRPAGQPGRERQPLRRRQDQLHRRRCTPRARRPAPSKQGTNTTPQNLAPDSETDPPTEPFSAWLGRLGAGEPYSVAPQTDDPVRRPAPARLLALALRLLLPRLAGPAGRRAGDRGVLGLRLDRRPVPVGRVVPDVHVPQGPGPEVARRGADRRHRARPRAEQARDLASHQRPGERFPADQIGGAHRATTDVASQVTDCTSNPSPAPQEVSAPVARSTSARARSTSRPRGPRS